MFFNVSCSDERLDRKALGPVDKESSSNETPTTESSIRSPASGFSQKEHVMRTSTDAAKNYVAQQSESISGANESRCNFSGEKTWDDAERGSIYSVEKIDRSQRMNVEELSSEDFSDDDLGVEGATAEDDCTAVEEGNHDEFVIHEESIGSQTSVGSTVEDAVFHRSGDCVDTAAVSSKKDACQANSSTDEEATSSSNSFYDVLGIAPPSPCFGSTQEIDAFLSTFMNRSPSPMPDEMPFTFSSVSDEEEVDLTMLFNMSSHNHAAEFSFPMFGASADEGASGEFDGDFVFDFDNPVQCEDDKDNEFHFNNGGFSNDDSSSDKDDGFNFFRF